MFLHCFFQRYISFLAMSHLRGDHFFLCKANHTIKSNRRETCRPLFHQLGILPLPSQYIFSLLLYVATNKKLFSHNSQIHDINTRHNNNLHLPLTDLTLVQKGVAYSGCKIFNHLPPQIKNISNNVALFKSKLKKLLLQYVLYSVDEYYQQNYKDYEW